MVEITIHLPDDLARQLALFGTLDSGYITALIQRDLDAQMAAMAEDADIQRELRAIDAEFRVTEPDGLGIHDA